MTAHPSTRASTSIRKARASASPLPARGDATHGLIEAFKKFKIKESAPKKAKKATAPPPQPAAVTINPLPQIPTINEYINADIEKLVNKLSAVVISKPTRKKATAPPPQPAAVTISPLPQTPTTNDYISADIEKLANKLSTVVISKPTRKPPVKRQAPPAHPYKRPVTTKTDKILAKHGMSKKGHATDSDGPIPAYLVESVANNESIKRINETVSLLNHRPGTPETFPSPFNWDLAWLSKPSNSAAAPPPTVEAQRSLPPPSVTTPNACNADSNMTDVVATKKASHKVEYIPQAVHACVEPITKKRSKSKNITETKTTVSRKRMFALDKDVDTITIQMAQCKVSKSKRARPAPYYRKNKKEIAKDGYEAEPGF